MQRGLTLSLIIAAILLPVSGCLPVSHLMNITQVTSNDPGSSTDASDDEEVAQGQCALRDESRPERTFCIGCYDYILATQCPGASIPEQCTNTSVTSNFTVLVNQCISNYMVGGIPCTKTCPTGTTLNPATCTCNATTPTPGGDGSTGDTDSGQDDYGPPIITLRSTTPSLTWTTYDLAASFNNSQSFFFNVRNRGNSIPRLNTYSIQAYWPAIALDTYGINLDNWIENFQTPAHDSTSSLMKSSFTVTGNAVAGNMYRFMRSYVFFNDFQTGTSGFTLGARDNTIPTLTSFLGTFDTSIQNLEFTRLNALPEGIYIVSFDLYLFDDWTGLSGDHRFAVAASSHGGAYESIFDHNFSTTYSQGQSYSGYTTVKGQDLGLMVPAEQKPDAIFPISIQFAHECIAPAASCPLTLKFTTQNLGATQFWGLDNFGVQPVKEFAAKYVATDTNALTSAYCLWFNLHTFCRNTFTTVSTTPRCTILASPTRSRVTNETLLAVNPNASTTCTTYEFPDYTGVSEINVSP